MVAGMIVHSFINHVIDMITWSAQVLSSVVAACMVLKHANSVCREHARTARVNQSSREQQGRWNERCMVCIICMVCITCSFLEPSPDGSTSTGLAA
jgi:hypothetical protein